MKKPHILLLLWLLSLSVLAVAAQGGTAISNTQMYFSNQVKYINDLEVDFQSIQWCPPDVCKFKLMQGEDRYIEALDPLSGYAYSLCFKSASHPEVNGCVPNYVEIRAGQCFVLTSIDPYTKNITYDSTCPSSNTNAEPRVRHLSKSTSFQ